MMQNGVVVENRRRHTVYSLCKIQRSHAMQATKGEHSQLELDSLDPYRMKVMEQRRDVVELQC